SQAWNATIPVIEAGLEEGLAHLNRNGTNNNLTADGWILRDGLYVKQNSVGDNYYIVTIKYSGRPEIVSQGYTYMQPNYASANGPFFAQISPNQTPIKKYVYRTVKTTTKIDGVWVKGMVAKDQIDLSGNNIHTDSFDSVDPLYSTNGQYNVS